MPIWSTNVKMKTSLPSETTGFQLTQAIEARLATSTSILITQQKKVNVECPFDSDEKCSRPSELQSNKAGWAYSEKLAPT